MRKINLALIALFLGFFLSYYVYGIDGGISVDGGIVHAPFEVHDMNDIPSQIGHSITFAKEGKWILFALVLVQLIVFLLKKFGQKLWKRWNIVIVTVLSGVSGILYYVANKDWMNAVLLFFTVTAPALVHDIYNVVKGKNIK